MLTRMRRATLGLALVALFACGEGVVELPPGTGAPDTGTVLDEDASAALDASTTTNADAAAPAPDREDPDPRHGGNETRDTDCDGLTDAEEFGTIWASGQR